MSHSKTYRLSKSYLTLTEPILRSLTGCKTNSPVMRPADIGPKSETLDNGNINFSFVKVLSNFDGSYLTVSDRLKDKLFGHETG
ncbi:MAG: hypothetical protein IPK35_17890 [Saprospiraceae bacterium]|nr:hypothetical protein [Saprospiraceae bacterium]